VTVIFFEFALFRAFFSVINTKNLSFTLNLKLVADFYEVINMFKIEIN